MNPTQVQIPTLVRIKPGALDRMGKYARRVELRSVAVLQSEGLPERFFQQIERSLQEHGVKVASRLTVRDPSFEAGTEIFAQLPSQIDGIIGLGGGKALDVAKYVAFLAHRPYIAAPTSLSNDGFCSPQSSLTLGSKRRSIHAALPAGVVVDTQVCLDAPVALWCSGVGDLAAKVTAVCDWKRAFHAEGTQVDDFAALLSDATVFQFIARPERDLEGVRLLATALMLNGVAMEICGSSRPASGSEHLISHALDVISARPRLHGLQVGVATYLMSLLQKQGTKRLGALFQSTGFWDEVVRDPFLLEDWEAALRLAPSLKQNFHTVLSEGDHTEECLRLLREDPQLAPCFIG